MWCFFSLTHHTGRITFHQKCKSRPHKSAHVRVTTSKLWAFDTAQWNAGAFATRGAVFTTESPQTRFVSSTSRLWSSLLRCREGEKLNRSFVNYFPFSYLFVWRCSCENEQFLLVCPDIASHLFFDELKLKATNFTTATSTTSDICDLWFLPHSPPSADEYFASSSSFTVRFVAIFTYAGFSASDNIDNSVFVTSSSCCCTSRTNGVGTTVAAQIPKSWAWWWRSPWW